MGLVLKVRVVDYEDEDLDADLEDEAEAVCEVEFEPVELLPAVRRLLAVLTDTGRDRHFRVLKNDFLFECFENGGEIEAADVEDLADELSEVEEALEEIDFKRPADGRLCEAFLDGMKQLTEMAQKHQTNIEIIQDDEGILLEDEEDEEDEENVVDIAEEDDSFSLENDEIEDEEIDPDFEAAMEREFSGEFESPSRRRPRKDAE